MTVLTTLNLYLNSAFRNLDNILGNYLLPLVLFFLIYFELFKLNKHFNQKSSFVISAIISYISTLYLVKSEIIKTINSYLLWIVFVLMCIFIILEIKRKKKKPRFVFFVIIILLGIYSIIQTGILVNSDFLITKTFAYMLIIIISFLIIKKHILKDIEKKLR